MLVTSIFSFSNNVFNPSQNKFYFLNHIYFYRLLMLLILTSPKFCRLVKSLKRLQKDKIIGISKIASICRRQTKCCQNQRTYHMCGCGWGGVVRGQQMLCAPESLNIGYLMHYDYITLYLFNCCEIRT